jgi:hypothetical protein
MIKKYPEENRYKESGNVLFLILIAVALFAALSYAVTQSSRSGGGNTSGETSLINSAQLTQYPASIRTSIIRMLVSGTTVDELNFNPPASFDNLSSTRVGVFHPSGGGAIYSTAPPDVMDSGNQGAWHFNANLEIPEIGTTGADGNDLIAFLPGITFSVCRKLNEELGITDVPNGDDVIPDVAVDLSSAGTSDGYDGDQLIDSTGPDANNDITFPTASDQPDIDDGSTSLDGQPYGCFRNTDGTYVYYHVLVER